MTTTAELLSQLNTTAAAVRDRSWASSGLNSGQPGLGNLANTTDPVSGLGSAGLGWFAPFVSFLSQPSSVLQGNPGPVTSGSTGFAQAAQTVSGLANQYQQASTSQTQGWSGDAASSYQGTSSSILDSISTLAESAYSMSDAIAGAGEVVGQAMGIITQLGTQAIGEIVPIMSQAVAAAPVTGGQSIAAAIPQCVAIATNYGQQMLAKLGELLASGQNLLKLVKGALAVVQLVTKALKEISDKSTGGGSDQSTQAGASQDTKQNQVQAPTSGGDAAADSASSGSASDSSSGLNSDGVSQTPVTSQSSDGTDPSAGPLTGAGRTSSTTTPSFATPHTSTAANYAGGGVPMGAMGGANGAARDTQASASRRTPGALTNAFDTDEKETTAGKTASDKNSAAKGTGTSGMPMGGRGAGQRSEDKEHKRSVQLGEDPEVFDEDDESVVLALPVIGEVVR